MEMDVTPAEQGAGAVLATLHPDPAKQMDRQYEAEADDTMNEQTWPTVEELPLTLTLTLTLTPTPALALALALALTLTRRSPRPRASRRRAAARARCA